MESSFDQPRAKCSKRQAVRFSQVALEALDDWVNAHGDNAYPSSHDKAQLKSVTGLEIRQLETWFANIRRRGRRHVRSDVMTIRSLEFGGAIDSRTRKPQATQPRLFQCTFCEEEFKTRYDWTRHETSRHFSLKRFICCPAEPTRFDALDNVLACVYCNQSNPSLEHLEQHNHSTCQARPTRARIFLRKDHLRQHLRSVHRCELLPHMNEWQLEASHVNSRCGFCGERFTSWTKRNVHIGNHYREGYRMSDWKGCRGLDTAVIGEVRNAIPPFLIGAQKSEASSDSTQVQIATRSNFKPQDLILHLQDFVNEKILISDSALQAHARSIIYGTSDTLNKTAADHPEWLDMFKRAYCLRALPRREDGVVELPVEDLEVYHDLGLTIPHDSQEMAEAALVTLFWNTEPALKAYTRFSSLIVPTVQMLPFATISAPWPDSGVLGQILITSDLFFTMDTTHRSLMWCPYEPEHDVYERYDRARVFEIQE
ncbi:hypothetical protein K461DRAFT_130359 [Myriangium duriaei CBS 260.36]|uniref:Homeobox domain-containing protein n=1 Tax=Myriangium duriaei CBS 260.36 TaxID=1168546 RepID=A0A9P4J0A7_9PEZI|nr:hypothetical protein K461DRAFT_130359 [Myriangium duriaei CBS 260.36]